MAIIAWLLAAGWLIVWLAPETPIARTLRRYLVDFPAAHLTRLERHHFLLAGVVVAIFLTAAWLGRDAIGIAAMGTPELTMLLGSIDLSVTLDLAVAAVMAWPARRGISVVKEIVCRCRAGKRAARETGSRPTRRREAKAANDDDRPGRLVA